VTTIARRRPLRAVFRDSGFPTDADRINTEQIFAQMAPSADVRAI
jgi:adenine-specific DNA-methyltransferase